MGRELRQVQPPAGWNVDQCPLQHSSRAVGNFDPKRFPGASAEHTHCRLCNTAFSPEPKFGNGTRRGAAVWDGLTWKQVKNLGWLLREWKNVDALEVAPSTDPRFDAWLVAYLDGGRVYVTPFASRSVLTDFLARPVLLDLPLRWYGVETVVSKGLR